MQDALTQLRSLFGSQKAVADLLGVAPSTVSMWRRNGVPPERRFRIISLCAERGLPLDVESAFGAEFAAALSAAARDTQPSAA